LSERKLPFQPLELRLAETLSIFVYYSKRLCYSAQPLCGPFGFPTGIDQESKIPRPEQPCPCGLAGSQPLTDLRDAFLV